MGPPPIFTIFGQNGSPNIQKDSFCPLFFESGKKIDFHQILGVLGRGAQIGPPRQNKGSRFFVGSRFREFLSDSILVNGFGSPNFWLIFTYFFHIFIYLFSMGGRNRPPLGRIGCFVNFWSKFQFFFKNSKFSPNFFSAYHRYPKVRKSHGVPLKCI